MIVPLYLFSCSKDAIDLETFGIIEGLVIDSETEEPVRNVNITTTPPTHSILTNDNGEFEFDEIPTGSYSVKASKPGYRDKTVSVSVREDRVANATIFILKEPEDTNEQEVNVIEAEVTSWGHFTINDSSFVDVEYRVENISENTDVNEFEVYFEITANDTNYFYELSGTNLRVGQQRFGAFSKYIRQDTPENVEVLSVWFE